MSAQDVLDRFLDVSAPYWRENVDMQAIFMAQAAGADELDGRVLRYLVNEFYTDRMTEWGLRIQESRYGLDDDVQRTLEERRGRLRARKRGGKNATIADLELIAAGFVGGEVEVTIDYDAFTATIEFVDILGVPTRISDVQVAMDRALPAHYHILYAYRYNTYNDIKTAYATYDELVTSGLVYSQILTTEGD